MEPSSRKIGRLKCNWCSWQKINTASGFMVAGRLARNDWDQVVRKVVIVLVIVEPMIFEHGH